MLQPLRKVPQLLSSSLESLERVTSCSLSDELVCLLRLCFGDLALGTSLSVSELGMASAAAEALLASF